MKRFTMRELMGGGVFTASALSLFLAFGSVNAAEEGAMDTGGQAGVSFSELDADGDGILSRDEAQAGISPDVSAEELDQRFSSADQNGDGMLDEAEFAAFEQPVEGEPMDEGAMESPDEEVSPEGME